MSNDFIIPDPLPSKGDFVIDGVQLPYYDWFSEHPRCANPMVCERRVELPIGYHFYSHSDRSDTSRLLEIGNVLDWWYNDAQAGTTHDSVDLFETGRQGVINVDIVDYEPDYTYESILSLSTFEHIGLPEYGDTGGAGKAVDAVVHTLDLLSDTGTLMFTIPVGHNAVLEEHLQKGVLSFMRKTYMYRVDDDNNWQQTHDWDLVEHMNYKSRFPYANAIYIVSHANTEGA